MVATANSCLFKYWNIGNTGYLFNYNNNQFTWFLYWGYQSMHITKYIAKQPSYKFKKKLYIFQELGTFFIHAMQTIWSALICIIIGNLSLIYSKHCPNHC